MAPASRSKDANRPEGLEVHVVKGLLGDFVCGVFVDPLTDLRGLQKEIAKATGLAPFQHKLLRRGVPPERLPLVHLDDLSARGLGTRLKLLLPEAESPVHLTLIIRQPEEAQVLSQLQTVERFRYSWQPAVVQELNELLLPWWESHDVVKAAASIYNFGKRAVELASPDLQDSEDILLTAIKGSEDAWAYASERLRQDTEVVSRAAAINGKIMKFVVQKDYVMKVLSGFGLALQHAPKELQDDADVVRAAIEDDPTSIRFASKRLRSQKDLLLFCIQKNGDNLRYASNVLKDDEEVVRVAVASDGCALAHASGRLRGSREIALLATATSSTALSCTTEELRADKELMQAVISHFPSSLGLAAGSLKDDLELVLLAVRACGDSLRHASAAMRGNVTVVLAAVSEDPAALQHCASKQAVLAAAEVPGCRLQSVPSKFRDDPDVVRAFKGRT